MDICVFDIETCSAAELHRRPDFMRLYGYTERDGSVTTTPDVERLLARLTEAQAVSAYAGISFDVLALAKWTDLDYEAICAKMWDGLLIEKHINPIAAQGMQPTGFYSLDQACVRHGVTRKTDDIKRLARLHGGFDKIPLDDPEYHAYLVGDVEAARGLLAAQQKAVALLPESDRRYIRREHAVETAMGRIALGDFRVDVDLTMARHAAGQERLENAKLKLHHEHGMPLEGKAPHRSKLGKAAFRRAVLATGIPEDALDANWPIGKDGALLTGKDVLNELIPLFEKSNQPAAELCGVIKSMNGERSVYGTVLHHLVDGSVHPSYGTWQASGRVSVQDPGLTVLKKSERDILLPDNDDEWLVSIDGSQIDARMVAAMSGCSEYAKLFAPGLDMHNEIAERVFSKRDGKWRKLAKVAGHSWNYGAGATSLARNLGIDYDEAYRFDQGMTGSFPGVVRFKAEVRELAGCLGYGETAPEGDTYRVLTNPYGRTVRVERNRAYTQSVGLLCQSATRDSMMHAILRLDPAIRRKIRTFVHDEIVLSLPKDRAVEMSHQLAESMAFELRGIPITFGGGDAGPNWAACYE